MTAPARPGRPRVGEARLIRLPGYMWEAIDNLALSGGETCAEAVRAIVAAALAPQPPTTTKDKS